MHDLDWDDLRVFLAAARTGSFSRAAVTLGVQQSTVSRRIQHLEQVVGGALFLRGAAGLTPTARGASLIAGATEMEAAALRAQRAALNADDAVRGEVRIAVAPGLASLWLVPRLAALLDAWPALQVELVVSMSLADLSRREADLALRFAQPAGEGLVARRLGALEHAVLAHPRWVGVPWSGLRWVGLTVPGLETAEETWTAAHGAPPVLRTSDYVSAFAAIRAGMGVMIGARALVGVDGVIELSTPVPLPPPAPLWLVGHEGTRSSPRVDVVWRAVLQWVEDDLGART